MVTIAEARERKKRRLEEKRRIRQCYVKKNPRQKQRKPIRKISQKQKQKSDYVKVCCQTFGVKHISEIPSPFSGKPCQIAHHIRGKIGKLRDDPYNLLPMTREEHNHHHQFERTRAKKEEHTILLRNLIDNVKVQQQESDS